MSGRQFPGLAVEVRRIDRLVDRFLHRRVLVVNRANCLFGFGATQPVAQRKAPCVDNAERLRILNLVERAARSLDRFQPFGHQSRLPRTKQARRQRHPTEPRNGIVGAQVKPMLGARGEHPIGLADPLKNEVVDHHPDIALRAIEGQRCKVARPCCGIGPSDQPLRRRLLIAGRAIDLSSEEQSAAIPMLERGAKPPRISIAILDGITRLDHHRAFEADDGVDQLLLCIGR